MRKSRFTHRQILAIIKKAGDGIPVTEIFCDECVSSTLFCRWRAKHDGVDASMISRVKEFEVEISRL